MKIRPVGEPSFSMQTDRRTDMTKLIVVSFAILRKPPIKELSFRQGGPIPGPFVWRVTPVIFPPQTAATFLGIPITKATLPSYHTGFRSAAKCFTFIFNGDQLVRNKPIISGNSGDIIFINFRMLSSDSTLSFQKSGAPLYVTSTSHCFFCLGNVKYYREAIFEPPRDQRHLLNVT